jgi:hypothetical protein
MGKRMKVLGKRRSMIIVTAAVLLLAVGAWVGSGANFSKSAASANNTFTAGYVDLTPSGPIMSLDKMAPGHEYEGVIGVTNAGDVDGRFYLKVTGFTDTISGYYPGSASLSEVLRLRIEDGTGNVLLAEDTLTNLIASGAEADCGVLIPADATSATVVARFPDGSGPRGADNKYQKNAIHIEFEWVVVSN